MKKLFDKSEILFAMLWIVVYVVGFSNADLLSEAIGFPKVITACLGLVLSLLLFFFLRKHRLGNYFGLCRFKGSLPGFLFFLPLLVITSVNFWCGLTLPADLFAASFGVLVMCFVGFLEEVIFRGFLFKAMCKSGVKSAIIVSSLTFGVGHIVNLTLGASLPETLLQLIYASAVGFCYTMIVYKGGSLLPCIFSHILINATSIFAAEPSGEMMILLAAVQTVLGIGYGVWLGLANRKAEQVSQ